MKYKTILLCIALALLCLSAKAEIHIYGKAKNQKRCPPRFIFKFARQTAFANEIHGMCY